jgi:hypothetical protein
MFRYIAVLFVSLAFAQNPEVVKKEIEAAYVRALEALRQAKTMDDLDEINRSFDTLDWQSISFGQPPRTWQDLRKYGLDGLRAPFASANLIIDTFEVNGDTAVLTGKLRMEPLRGEPALVPLKETWKRTSMGWKRQIHQKFRPGETPK